VTQFAANSLGDVENGTNSGYRWQCHQFEWPCHEVLSSSRAIECRLRERSRARTWTPIVRNGWTC